MTNTLKEKITAYETTIANTKKEKKEAEKLLEKMGNFFLEYGVSLSTQKLEQHIDYLNTIIADEKSRLAKAKKALKKFEEAEKFAGEI